MYWEIEHKWKGSVPNSYLYAAVLLPTQLDLAEFAFANCISQNEVSKFGSSFVAATVVMPATAASSLFCWGVHGHDGRLSHVMVILRCCVVSSTAIWLLGVGNCADEVIASVVCGFRVGRVGADGYRHFRCSIISIAGRASLLLR